MGKHRKKLIEELNYALAPAMTRSGETFTENWAASIIQNYKSR